MSTRIQPARAHGERRDCKRILYIFLFLLLFNTINHPFVSAQWNIIGVYNIRNWEYDWQYVHFTVPDNADKFRLTFNVINQSPSGAYAFVCFVRTDNEEIDMFHPSSGSIHIYEYSDIVGPINLSIIMNFARAVLTVEWYEKTTTTITCIKLKDSLIINQDQTFSGSISPSIPNVDVLLTITSPDSNITTETVKTDSNGHYSYTYRPLKLGEWSVSARWAGNLDYSGSDSSVTRFNVVEAPKLGNLILSILDGGGLPVQGALVYSSSAPSGQPQVSTVTDIDGQSVFDNILVGVYTLRIEKTGYDFASFTVDIKEGETLSEYYQLQEQVSSLRVIVKDLKGNYIDRAVVVSVLYPQGQSQLSDTTVNGILEYPIIKPGSYTIEVSVSGYTKQAKTVTCITGMVTALQFDLQEVQQVDINSGTGGIPGFGVELIFLGMLIGFFILNRKRINLFAT